MASTKLQHDADATEVGRIPIPRKARCLRKAAGRGDRPVGLGINPHCCAAAMAGRNWSRMSGCTLAWSCCRSPLPGTAVGASRRFASSRPGMGLGLSLFSTAAVSFTIRDLNDGDVSFIHIFSLVTVVTVPGLVLAARHHRIARPPKCGALAGHREPS